MADDKPAALTPAQAEVLKFIRHKCSNAGLPPSYREIQTHFGYRAIGTVQDHVKALIKKGHLQKPGGKGRSARGILPTGFRPEGVNQVPVYGEIAAGLTRDSQQLDMGQVAVSQRISDSPSFALRVVGTSMVDAGIFEGDLLIVERTSRVSNGDIVVALVDNETTVKRYEKKGSTVSLIPENSRMKPIEIREQKLEIQGKVVGLQRKI